MTKYIIGIDPGKSGAIAFINKENLKGSFVHDYSAEADMRDLLLEQKENIDIAVIERLTTLFPNPKQVFTHKTNFVLGENFGFWKGMLVALAIPFVEIAPRDWKKGLVKAKGSAEQKIEAVRIANQLFPEINIPKTKHGRADALLIAYSAL